MVDGSAQMASEVVKINGTCATSQLIRINGRIWQQIQGRLSSSSTTSWVLMLPNKVPNLKIFLTV